MPPDPTQPLAQAVIADLRASKTAREANIAFLAQAATRRDLFFCAALQGLLMGGYPASDSTVTLAWATAKVAEKVRAVAE